LNTDGDRKRYKQWDDSAFLEITATKFYEMMLTERQTMIVRKEEGVMKETKEEYMRARVTVKVKLPYA
jgi:hypothetical protein